MTSSVSIQSPNSSLVVTLSAPNLPSGVTIGFSPNSGVGNFTSTMTVNVSSSTPTGVYQLTIEAITACLVFTSLFTLTVVAGGGNGFNLLLSPDFGTAVQGGSVYSTVSVNSFGGTPLDVTLSMSGLPPGASAYFSPQSGMGNFTSSITITSSPTTPPGFYELIVTGYSSWMNQSVFYALTVQAQSTSNSTSPPANNSSTMRALTIRTSLFGVGSVSPQPGTYSVPAGSIITINATPEAGWVLSSWFVNGNFAGNDSSITLDIQQDTTVLIIFSSVQEDLSQISTVSIVGVSSYQGQILVDGRLYNLPTSFEWILGSEHQISATPNVALGAGERALFLSWVTPTGQIVNPNLDFIVNGSAVIAANFALQASCQLNFTDAYGSALQNVSALLTDGISFVAVDNGQIVWLNYSTTYTLANASWNGIALQPASGKAFSLQVTEPISATVPLSLYAETIRVVDIFGLPISGASVIFTLPNGTEVTEMTNTFGYATLSEEPLKPDSVRITYLDVSDSIANPGSTSSNTTVVLAMSYPVFVILILFGASLLFTFYRERLKRLIFPPTE
jgi:hypothetical protein